MRCLIHQLSGDLPRLRERYRRSRRKGHVANRTFPLPVSVQVSMGYAKQGVVRVGYLPQATGPSAAPSFIQPMTPARQYEGEAGQSVLATVDGVLMSGVHTAGTATQLCSSL